MLKIRRRSSRWRDEIAAMDAHEDCHDIIMLLGNRVFPMDLLIATEIAQLRTFTIPTIAKLLHQTRQFENEGQKRLDDTKALLSEIIVNRPDSERGKEYVEHLNKIHGFYKISNDDYLYTLSTFVFDGKMWLERFGWRQYTEHEHEAVFQFYKQLGEAMKIQEIPESIEAFWAWRCEYEERAAAFSPANKQVALGLLESARRELPWLIRPIFIPATSALLDDDFRDLLGLKKPSALLRAGVSLAMKVRKALLTRFTIWDDIWFWDTAFFNTYPTYPSGYKVTQLGPKKVLDFLARQGERAEENKKARSA